MTQPGALMGGGRIGVAVVPAHEYAQLLFLQSWSIWRRTTYASGSDEEKTLSSGQIRGC
jgi:hypothetical protein